jgi:short-chain fatty acids transporter
VIAALSSTLTRWCQRWIPDGYVIAAVLTVLILGVALVATPHGPAALAEQWGKGFWGFIPFTLQMSMVILTGFVVAEAPPVQRALATLAAQPRTATQAVALTALTAMALAWLNWGLGIVAAAVLARRVGERRIADFRVLVASSYLGMGCTWHAGLSASAPLTSSDASQGFVKQYLGGAVPVTDTIFALPNLVLVLVTMVVMTLVAVRAHPHAESYDGPEPEAPPPPPAPPRTPAERLERAWWLNGVFVALVAWSTYAELRDGGLARLNINHVNLLFFGLGALLHPSPASLLAAAERGGRNVWGVLVQFGLYAGIAGVLDKSGLAAQLADVFVRVASPQTFPLLVVWYSGLLNYVMPSGGAKWFIELQYLAEASRTLGVPMSTTVMAYAWGDMLTDLIQPFWAIPMLAVVRLGFRDIMGICAVMFVVYAALVSVAFAAWGFL